jgi:hypothetical protein
MIFNILSQYKNIIKGYNIERFRQTDISYELIITVVLTVRNCRQMIICFWTASANIHSITKTKIRYSISDMTMHHIGKK